MTSSSKNLESNFCYILTSLLLPGSLVMGVEDTPLQQFFK